MLSDIYFDCFLNFGRGDLVRKDEQGPYIYLSVDDGDLTIKDRNETLLAYMIAIDKHKNSVPYIASEVEVEIKKDTLRDIVNIVNFYFYNKEEDDLILILLKEQLIEHYNAVLEGNKYKFKALVYYIIDDYTYVGEVETDQCRYIKIIAFSNR